MPEETRASKIFNHARGVYGKAKELTDVAVKLWLWGGAVLSAITGGLAVVSNATELQRGVLWGVAFTLLVLVAAFWVRGLWRYLFEKLPEPPALPVPCAVVEQWRKLYEWWAPAFDHAVAALHAVCGNASGDSRKFYLFARTCAVKPFEDACGKVATLLRAPADTVFAADLKQIEDLFARVLLDHYHNLYSWLDAAGESALGRDGLDNHPVFIAWRKSHTKAVSAMTRARPDLGVAAQWIDTLAGFTSPWPENSAPPE